MLRSFPCLVLDHDDTVVASEASVNYPCFLLMLEHFRPGQTMPPEEFTRWCFDPGFGALLKEKYHFTDKEMDEEYQMWLDMPPSTSHQLSRDPTDHLPAESRRRTGLCGIPFQPIQYSAGLPPSLRH